MAWNERYRTTMNNQWTTLRFAGPENRHDIYKKIVERKLQENINTRHRHRQLRTTDDQSYYSSPATWDHGTVQPVWGEGPTDPHPGGKGTPLGTRSTPVSAGGAGACSRSGAAWVSPVARCVPCCSCAPGAVAVGHSRSRCCCSDCFCWRSRWR